MAEWIRAEISYCIRLKWTHTHVSQAQSKIGMIRRAKSQKKRDRKTEQMKKGRCYCNVDTTSYAWISNTQFYLFFFFCFLNSIKYISFPLLFLRCTHPKMVKWLLCADDFFLFHSIGTRHFQMLSYVCEVFLLFFFGLISFFIFFFLIWYEENQKKGSTLSSPSEVYAKKEKSF